MTQAYYIQVNSIDFKRLIMCWPVKDSNTVTIVIDDDFFSEGEQNPDITYEGRLMRVLSSVLCFCKKPETRKFQFENPVYKKTTVSISPPLTPVISYQSHDSQPKKA